MRTVAQLMREKRIPASLDIVPLPIPKEHEWLKLKLLRSHRDRAEEVWLEPKQDFVYTLGSHWDKPLIDKDKGEEKILCAYGVINARLRRDIAEEKRNEISWHTTIIPKSALFPEDVIAPTGSDPCPFIAAYAAALEIKKNLEAGHFYTIALRTGNLQSPLSFIEKVEFAEDLGGVSGLGEASGYIVVPYSNNGDRFIKVSAMQVEYKSLAEVTRDDLLTCPNEFLRKRFVSDDVKKQQDALEAISRDAEKRLQAFQQQLKDLWNAQNEIVRSTIASAANILQPGIVEPWKLNKENKEKIKQLEVGLTTITAERNKALQALSKDVNNEIRQVIVDGKWLTLPPE